MNRRSKTRKKTRSIKLNPLVLLLPLLSILLIYSTYFLISFLTIKTDDLITNNASAHRILSSRQPDIETTMVVFEKGGSDGSYISDIYISLLNRKKGTSSLIYVPGSLHVPISEASFGESLQISSLGYAGDFFQEGRGVEYAVWQLGEVLGFRPNNYIWITDEADSLFSEIYGGGRVITEKEKGKYRNVNSVNLSSSFFSLHEFSVNLNWVKTYTKISRLNELDGKIYSNFSFGKVMNRLSVFRRLSNSTEMYGIDLSSPALSEEVFSTRGGVIKRMEVNSYDRALRSVLTKLIPRDLERERVRVEVYNASGLSGKALLYSRKIQNAGLEVVRFETAPGFLDTTEIYISNIEQFRNSYNVVSDILLDRFDVVDGRPAFMTTGDIVIILGEDISAVDLF